jgi:hypothetical protein
VFFSGVLLWTLCPVEHLAPGVHPTAPVDRRSPSARRFHDKCLTGAELDEILPTHRAVSRQYRNHSRPAGCSTENSERRMG